MDNVGGLSLDQLKEELQRSGGERQLRLVASWMDAQQTTAAQFDPVQQLDTLLPLVDLFSLTDKSLFDFMGEDNVMIVNSECR